MSEIILKAEHVHKQYRLGVIGTGTINNDIKRWWYRIRGKEDPFLKIGDENDRSLKGNSDYVWALKNVNFEVKQGEVLGIIGKNGAGKSTLLKILSRVTTPTKGQINIKGKIASLLEVGTGFHPEMTGRENIYLNGAILGMTKSEIKTKEEEIINFSGCLKYIDTPVKRYSSGMRVRLAFAVAAHLEPDILVVDEVLAVGDAEFQKKAIGKMQDISKGDGRTVLFVSHNMAAVKNLCTRAIVLDNGTVAFCGKVENAIKFYLEESSTINYNARFNNRKGSGLVKIKNVELYGKDKTSNPQSGNPFTMTFFLDNPEKINVNDIRFDLRIDDNLGQRICWLSTRLTNNKLEDGKSSISFYMERLQLNDGIYYVTTYIEVNNEVSDWVENAFSFEVEKGDYYNTGFFVPNGQSKALLNFKIMN